MLINVLFGCISADQSGDGKISGTCKIITIYIEEIITCGVAR